MLPEVPELNQFPRSRSDHGLQQPPRKQFYHRPNISKFKDQNKLQLLQKVTAFALQMAKYCINEVICPSMKWFCCPQLQSAVWLLALQIKRPKKKLLTLPSAPSSTPSSPSTISVETETPPEGCRCFCPSILRSLNADKKRQYWKMQHKPRLLYGKHQSPPTTYSQRCQVRVLCENSASLNPISKKALIKVFLSKFRDVN